MGTILMLDKGVERVHQGLGRGAWMWRLGRGRGIRQVFRRGTWRGGWGKREDIRGHGTHRGLMLVHRGTSGCEGTRGGRYSF